MKKQSRLLTMLKNIINIRYWLDFERIKTFTLYLLTGIKNMFVPQPRTSGEDFSEAVKTLHLSPEDLEARKKGLYRLSLIMMTLALGLLGYGLYHLYYGAWRATLLSLVVFLIALVLAFRYHFWYFQIKQRKLGCTIREWFRQGILGDKK